MKCPTCEFTTHTRDINLYVHFVDQHDIPHATAHVLFIQAIREAYPMTRWIERLTPKILTGGALGKKCPTTQGSSELLDNPPKEKGS